VVTAVATRAPADLADVLVRLGELGPPSEIRNGSPAVAAAALDLDRVLLTSIRDGTLRAEGLHVAGGRPDALLATLRAHPVALDYPLVEGEIMRRRRGQVVRASPGESPGRRAFADILGWEEYATAPILVDGRAIGFFHGDRKVTRRPVDDADVEALTAFAVCFGVVFERAVLRHRLRVQRHEMRQVASWADARTSELGERSVTLAEEAEPEERGGGAIRPSGGGENALRDLLTRRELEVLRLMVHGETNAGIARHLVVSEGTVKFHVKNILRKMHAANRAEATSRYLRMTLNHGGDGRD
jgi:LuxR family transcriptional regulator, regulator of acetate metabolism